MEPHSAPETRTPPTRLGPMLRRVGPGMVVAGSIVGSGELIATTKVGAESGFVLLWLILIGCGIKVFAQVEFGRRALIGGRTALEALDEMPGPRLKVGWPVWGWLAMTLLALGQQGGIVGALGMAVSMQVPATEQGARFQEAQDAWVQSRVELALARGGRIGDVEAGPLEAMASEEARLAALAQGLDAPTDPLIWGGLIAVLTAVLLYFGRYGLIERFSTVLVAGFTLVTTATLALLQTKEGWAVGWGDVREGLSLGVPEAGIGSALAAFGIIGVGAAELIMYPYWCLEKGYARWTGPPEDSDTWRARARGWMRVLRVDAWLSMVVYTVATAVFFLLGAAVLGRAGLDPEGENLVRILREMYVPVFGDWAAPIFLGGAFAVLYSTFFVGCGGMARIAADGLGLFGLVGRDEATRALWSRRMGAVYPLLGFVIFAFVRAPAKLVLAAGVAQALMLTVLGAGALYFRYRKTPRELMPGRAWDLGLWVSCIGFFIVGGWLLYTKL